MHDVVQPPLQQAHQHVAGVALGARAAAEVAAELPLQHAVVVLDLLLLAQVHAVVGLLAAAELVHARAAVAALDRALGRVAARALEEQLHPVAAAEPANGSGDTSHAILERAVKLMVCDVLAR